MSYNYEEPIASWGHDDISLLDIIDGSHVRRRINELKQKEYELYSSKK
mgnify:CR=1 FL=1